MLTHLDYLDEAITTVSAEVATRLAPFAESLTHLDTVPGIARRTAEMIVAEIGVDMRRFPSDRHLASWAGLCPGNNESAGKHKSGKTRKGNRWLRLALIEAAIAATRTKDSALGAIAESCAIAATRKRSSRSPTRCCEAFIISSPRARPTVTPARTTTTDVIPHRVTRHAIELLEHQGYRVLEPAA